jgi:hypothetical protein
MCPVGLLADVGRVFCPAHGIVLSGGSNLIILTRKKEAKISKVGVRA